MKYVYLSLILFISIQSFGQDNRILLKGKVTSDSVAVEDAHVINYSSRTGVITGADGNFEIPVKTSDTLIISSIEYKQKVIIINSTHLTSNFLNVFLEPAVTELDEIILLERKDYMQSIDTPAVQVSANTLALPNAGKKTDYTYTERKINYITNGSNITKLHSLITGKKKKLKKIRKEESNNMYLEKIRADFTDAFFINTLQLQEKQIGPYIAYCQSKKDIISLYKKEDKFGILDIFMNTKEEFIALPIEE